MDQAMRIITCGPEHLESIRAIFNEAVVNSTAIYDYHPRSVETLREWFEAKQARGLPVIGVEDGDGVLMGFGSYGPFRALPAYKYTVEHLVYVDARFRGLGLGRLLLEQVIQSAQARGFHMLVGVIDAENASSIALHERLGFKSGGGLRHAGFKFGRWLDLVFYQKLLPTPESPVDG